ncbi:MAG: hypothetical protein DQL95_09220 [Lactobacillus helveticus]|nr:MAG: hypothetical protein DQL95_09220 [Lactobacillus helveticus]
MVLIQKLLNITYTPNKQTTNIVYKDKDGQTIKTDKVDGKTDETIPVDPTKYVPAGWKIIPDQKIPETVKVTPDGVPTVVVKIEHKTITVTPETPEGGHFNRQDLSSNGKHHQDSNSYNHSYQARWQQARN